MKLGLMKVRAMKNGVKKLGSFEIGLAEIGPVKNNVPFKAGLVQICPPEIDIVQIAQVQSIRIVTHQMLFAQVRGNLWMLVSPGIPISDSFPQHFEEL